MRATRGKAPESPELGTPGGHCELDVPRDVGEGGGVSQDVGTGSPQATTGLLRLPLLTHCASVAPTRQPAQGGDRSMSGLDGD